MVVGWAPRWTGQTEWTSLLTLGGHVLMDNRHDLIVDCRVTQDTGTGERDVAKTKSSPKE
jgi:hypothetical protein